MQVFFPGVSGMLPVPARTCKRWKITQWTNPERAAAAAKELRVTCVPRAVGMRSGTGFHAAVPGVFPCDAVTLGFKVFFPKDFEFVKGGKIGLGAGWGPVGGASASGGSWLRDGGSFRLMWREGGEVIGYAYLPLDVGKGVGKDRGTRATAVRAQPLAFRVAARRSTPGAHGLNLWLGEKNPMRFRRGAWNDVEVGLALNAPGQRDGALSVRVNEVSRKLEGLVLRADDATPLRAAIFTTFFGGSSSDWASPAAQVIRFKDFKISKS
jgi:hypothetical protein